MKLNLKTTGVVTFGKDDHFKIIGDYLKENYNVTLTKLQQDTSGTYNCEVVGDSIDEGAKLFGKEKKETVTKESNAGYTRTWKGFYKSVKMIVDEQKKRNKKFISFDDLYAELLDVDDKKGGKMFVKGKDKLEPWRFKQYITPSQLKRQLNMRGIQRDDKNGGLKF